MLRYARDFDYIAPDQNDSHCVHVLGFACDLGARPQTSRLISIKDEHARLAEETQTMQAKNEALEVSSGGDSVEAYYGMRTTRWCLQLGLASVDSAGACTLAESRVLVF